MLGEGSDVAIEILITICMAKCQTDSMTLGTRVGYVIVAALLVGFVSMRGAHLVTVCLAKFQTDSLAWGSWAGYVIVAGLFYEYPLTCLCGQFVWSRKQCSERYFGDNLVRFVWLELKGFDYEVRGRDDTMKWLLVEVRLETVVSFIDIETYNNLSPL